MTDDHGELLRVRERVHRLTTDVAALKFTVEAQAKRCDHVEALVNGMEREDAIAAAVAARLRREHLRLVSWPVKVAGFAVSVCAIASFALQVAH